MAKIRPRKESGLLYFDFNYRGQRCREQTTLPDTPANRRQMELVLKKIEAAMTLGQFNYLEFFPSSRKAHKLEKQSGGGSLVATPPVSVGSNASSCSEVPLFSDFASLWLMENEVRWRRATLESQTGLLGKHILPYFGERPVNAISKADLLGFRSHLASLPGPGNRDSLSAKTINEIMGCISAILNEAADRFGFVSPAKRIQRLKVKKVDIQPFSLDEAFQIIGAVREDYKSYMIVRFFTGMRSGEIHGLKWKCVDFERRQILIRETFTKGRTEYTKNDGSQREIHISDTVYEALKTQYEATRSMSEYVFCNGAGNPIDNKNFCDRVWYPLLRYLAMDARRPYQTRHTAATLWLAAGESPEWIARQMGHTSTQMLFSVYSRFVPNLTRQDGTAMERLLQNRLGGGSP